MDDALELSILPTAGAPARARLVRRITTIGSDPAADIRVPSLPRERAAVHKDPPAVPVRVLGTGASTPLAAGQEIDVAGVRIALERPSQEDDGLALGPLSEALSDATGAEEALETLLREIVSASGA